MQKKGESEVEVPTALSFTSPCSRSRYGKPVNSGIWNTVQEIRNSTNDWNP